MAPQALRWRSFQGLYLTYQAISTLFVRIPSWALFNLLRSWRPRKSWTIGRVIRVNLLRHYLSVLARSGPISKVPDHLSIAPGPNVHGVWVESVPELIGGELQIFADRAYVIPVRIPGYWLYKADSSSEITYPPQPGEKVILAFHGGAYVRLSAHPGDMTAAIARGLLEHVSAVQRVFSLEYRLSRGKPYEPAHPFPAALLDALAGYNYLVNTGDSAGGNLALALTRYLIENKNDCKLNLPAPPAGIILLSPWCDIGTSHDNIPGGSAATCVASDFLNDPTKGGFDYARDAFLDIHFKDFPRTFIVAGGAEVILDQIRSLKVKMVKDLGEGNGRAGKGKVTYFEASDAIHDYLVFPWHEPERSNTLHEINRWISAM
ncbi:Alpha/Beta hydrolase protein [Cyathus striatus]|nr:Alpha/Beta hydrolase protein [Cyathus striatus]